MAEEAQATPAENAQSNPHREQESCARPGLPGCAWENGPCRVLLEQGHTRNMVPSLLMPCDGQASLQAEVLCVAVSSANVLDSGRARLPWVHPGLLSFLPPSLPALPYSPQSLPSIHTDTHTRPCIYTRLLHKHFLSPPTLLLPSVHRELVPDCPGNQSNSLLVTRPRIPGKGGGGGQISCPCQEPVGHLPA